MEGVYCIRSFVEDGNEYWSEGCHYKIVAMEDDDILIRNNFNGIGRIYPEDFDSYFQKVET